MAEVCNIFKLIAFLFAGSECGMIPHQRCEDAECKPAQKQVAGCVGTETAQICSGVEESAHVQ